MKKDFLANLEIRKFRADEEDVYAYVQSLIRNTDKQEILSWITHLSDRELNSLITPYITEKMTAELGEIELR